MADTPSQSTQYLFQPSSGGAGDMLHFKDMDGNILSWIDNTGTGQGALAGGGSPGGGFGDIQFNKGDGTFTNGDGISSGVVAKVQISGSLSLSGTSSTSLSASGTNSGLFLGSGMQGINLNTTGPITWEGSHFSVTSDTGDVDITTPGNSGNNGFNVETNGGFVQFDAAEYNFQLPGMQIFSNNAAAISGGLIQGDFYRTGGDPDVVCIVH